MAANLTWKKTEENPVTIVVSGGLTEFADLARLQAELGADNELDLSGITTVNSTGVREWLKFVQSVDANNQHLVLRRCSVSFVNQLNMIRRFAGGARVASILAPYVCPECDAITDRLLELGDKQSPEILAQAESPLPCPSCGAHMVFDDVPTLYFSFLDESH